MFWGKIAGMTALVLTATLAASATLALIYRGPVAEAPDNKTPPVSAARKADTETHRPRTDAFGDPLPDGAIRRVGTLRFRQGGGMVNNLLQTPDGKTLISNSCYGPRTINVWDMATGKLLRRFPGSYDQRNAALSDDGKLVAIGQEKTIVLWNLASGKEVCRLAQADATGVAFSPDGKTLAAGGTYSGIHLWDVASRKKIAQLPWERDSYSTVLLLFTPDGKTLIVGQQLHSKFTLWDVASGKKRHELYGDAGGAALSRDGSILVTGGPPGGISLWDVKTGKLLRQFGQKEKTRCNGMAISPDGRIVAAMQMGMRNRPDEPVVTLWDVAAGTELKRFRIKSDWAGNIVFSRDGKTLIAASGSVILLWDVATGKETGPATDSARGDVGFVTISKNGRTLAYSQDDEIRLWDMRADREIGSVGGRSDSVFALSLAPDGRTLAASVGEHDINLWDVKDRQLLSRLPWDEKDNPYNWWSRTIAFSPDGRMLAPGYYGSCIVRIWDAASSKQIRQLNFKDDAKDFSTVESVVFSPDGKTLAVSGRGNHESSKVRLWDVATYKPLAHLNARLNDPSDKRPPDSVSLSHGPIIEPKFLFSPNGRMLATNRRQKTIPVWEAATGRQRLLLEGHDESTICVAFAPDGRTLASASWDNTIRLWDLDTGRELRKLTGHRGKANSLAFSADGNILVSAGDDTTILFWDVADVSHRKRPLSAPLAKQECQALWEDLAKDDAAKAYAAMMRMVAASSTTIAALKERLRPVRPADPERLTRLLKELDSDDFAVREAASRELEKLGDVVGPAVRQALARPGLSLELRRRLETVSTSLDEISGERLRSLRAVEVLELCGTQEAREVLKSLAAGAEGARLTEEAKSALKRLARQR
jgi:WD40 repeat protein